ncbi:MAG: MotA/TolQ/ExbB proton channel family protein, partial [Bacteroidales bacterium]|nr:MotA/TolQ/ExbB proton channel family protein [Bacteroidales bacterium]
PRGPVASICYQSLVRSEESIDIIDKSITAYGGVQAGFLEKNLSWITLFIAAAPSLGFLGTVIGMIQSFDEIQKYGDINPTIVAGGMKFALITTVGGLVVALILQFFYNYILNKIEGILSQMEDDSITILDILIKYKKKYQNHEAVKEQ